MSGHAPADVVVLGGGLVGASLAYELVSAGIGVTLLDASHPGRASAAGAGIASPETFNEADEDWYSFGADAARHLRMLILRLGEDGVEPAPDTFSECGSIALALAEHEDPWFTELLERASARSADVGEIPPQEARAMFPPLGRLWRAMRNPSAARIDGRALCDAILLAAVRRGATVMPASAVGIDRHADRVTAVELEDGSLSCGACVLATGAWSAQVGKWLGAELPVAPTKGQIVHVRLASGGRHGLDVVRSDRWPIVQPVLNFYLVPWSGGRVACGGTFEQEAEFDTQPTAGGMRDLLRECTAIAPGLAEATYVETRVGLRPTSSDDRPLLGRAPGIENAHVCTGHGANGLLLGPYSAALVAAGLVGTQAPPESKHLERYSVGRFAAG